MNTKLKSIKIQIPNNDFLVDKNPDDLRKYLQSQYGHMCKNKSRTLSFFIKFMNHNKYNYTHKFLKQNNIINLSAIDDELIVQSVRTHYPNHFLVLKIATSRVLKEFWSNNSSNSNPQLKIACVYDSRTDKYWFFNKNNIFDLFSLLLCGPRIVSYNGRRFDKRVLCIYGLKEWMNKNNVKWRGFDIFRKVYKKMDYMYSFESLIRANFNSGRKFSNSRILNLNYTQLKELCHDDVKNIRKMYLLYQSHQLKVPKLIKVAS